MKHLDSIAISGFKSIGRRQEIAIGDVTVFLGANGAGKSNVISFFKMLNSLPTNGLQIFVARNGMANAILHFGSFTTKSLSFGIRISDDKWSDDYQAELEFGMPDSLFFRGEHIKVVDDGNNMPFEIDLDSAGSLESKLNGEASDINYRCVQARNEILEFLSRVGIFQFHDTSDTSRLRASCYIENANHLMGDAGNLPAFLFAMKKNNPRYYQRIVQHVRTMIPQFQDFRLETSQNNSHQIFLNWIGERGDEYLFGPHQLSDGSLRYISLAALLLQPKETMPDVIVLDEPELGLHPSAITSLAEMIALAKKNCQVILATQSPNLANQFAVDDIVIAEYNKEENESTYRRLDSNALKDWLENYSLEELWEKNVLGGKP